MEAQILAGLELSKGMAATAQKYGKSAVARWILARAMDIGKLTQDVDRGHIEHHADINKYKAQAEAAKALCDKLLATRWGRIGARLWWGKILKGADHA